MAAQITIELSDDKVDDTVTMLMSYRGHADFWAGTDKPQPKRVNEIISELEKARGRDITGHKLG